MIGYVIKYSKNFISDTGDDLRTRNFIQYVIPRRDKSRYAVGMKKFTSHLILFSIEDHSPRQNAEQNRAANTGPNK